MRLQDHVVRSTQKALDDFLRALEAMPEDKLEWEPEEAGRSAMGQLQEVVMAPQVYLHVLESGMEGFEEKHGELMASLGERPGYVVLVAEARRSTSEFCAAISGLGDDRLEEEVVLPFGGGLRLTMAEFVGLHAWNLVYHLGQVNYIQTLYGDKEMH